MGIKRTGIMEQTIKSPQFALHASIIILLIMVLYKVNTLEMLVRNEMHKFGGKSVENSNIKIINEQQSFQRNMTDGQSPVLQVEPVAEWTIPDVPSYIQDLKQDNPALSDHIRVKWIVPPYKSGTWNLTKPKQLHYSQAGQSEFVDNFLKQRTGGFFVEAGAANGEGLSNSLFFEKSRNWTGLLVEANRGYFKSLLYKRRHAHMINACLSPVDTPVVLDFRDAQLIGGLTNYMEETHKARVVQETGQADAIKVQCFPLAAILMALNVSHVDFFSLDVEGAELDILQTFPFDRITVDMLSIEYQISNDLEGSQKKLADIKTILVDQFGYKVVRLDGDEDVILSRI